MTRRGEHPLHHGDAVIRPPRPSGGGEWVQRGGERFYKIAGFGAMPPFLMSVVSGFDHWLFLSSTGGVTCGRRCPEAALFPYVTDDKVHDACATTGPKTLLRVEREGATSLWQPFAVGPSVYDIERNLFKNVPGNKVVFEEINHDLQVAFEYSWTSGDRFGFVRDSRLRNTGEGEVRAEVIDGLRNLLPYGVERGAQSELSTLIDGYKQAESIPDARAGIFTLSSILTDRAEPNEALKATIVWCAGLEGAAILLSEDQLDAFCNGGPVEAETTVRGKRGAFFVHFAETLPPGAERRWCLLADIEQGPAQASGLLDDIRRGVGFDAIEEDVAAGTSRLETLAGFADAFQLSADETGTGRHFSNTLFNIMRGGVFPHGYRFPREDFLDFTRRWNRPLQTEVERLVADLDEPLELGSVLARAEAGGNDHLVRLVYEYLPLTFSRRHGDPSRPWNHFTIHLQNDDGSEVLHYQGNWRDIFQNWEALALSFPEFAESFVAKFVNASTADGFNPYRISRDGIDWETPEPDNPWANIGYWGDHQIVYLSRLLELSRDYHPGRLGELLTRRLFVYADVPYRIKPYGDLVRDPHDTIEFDDERARAVAERVAETGADGKLVARRDGTIHRVTLLEKLLIPALAKVASLVPGGGIWMNTQRPEWNDANNALVGYGLSMVTLGYLRRYLRLLDALLDDTAESRFEVSREAADYLAGVTAVLESQRSLCEAAPDAVGRKAFMDAMGAVNDRYRTGVYDGPCGAMTTLDGTGVDRFVQAALAFLDHSLEHGRRDDGLFHAYNLIRFDGDGYGVEPLDEMLEGQVAVLSSGYLDGEATLDLLEALASSRLYCPDRNSYTLYPDRTLPSFLDKNVIPQATVEANPWIRQELEDGRATYVERGGNGRVHFNGSFRNATVLEAALASDPDVSEQTRREVLDVYEEVFEHRRFTGRSGSMVKYEGLGSIYWHMVSKLVLATAEIAMAAADDGADAKVVDGLSVRFAELREGLGVHRSPADYGAFPVDPYSHTPGFAGVQQPGLTGQVKEDVITRFRHLGVRVAGGEVRFEPLLLAREEFVREPSSWVFRTNGAKRREDLPANSLGFTLCGVPVIYRIAESSRLEVHAGEEASTVFESTRLGETLSRSLFRREGRIRKLIVDVPESVLGSTR